MNDMGFHGRVDYRAFDVVRLPVSQRDKTFPQLWILRLLQPDLELRRRPDIQWIRRRSVLDVSQSLERGCLGFCHTVNLERPLHARWPGRQVSKARGARASMVEATTGSRSGSCGLRTADCADCGLRTNCYPELLTRKYDWAGLRLQRGLAPRVDTGVARATCDGVSVALLRRPAHVISTSSRKGSYNCSSLALYDLSRDGCSQGLHHHRRASRGAGGGN